MVPIFIFLVLAVVIIVLLVAVVLGGIGSISKGPNPSEGDKHIR